MLLPILSKRQNWNLILSTTLTGEIDSKFSTVNPSWVKNVKVIFVNHISDPDLISIDAFFEKFGLCIENLEIIASSTYVPIVSQILTRFRFSRLTHLSITEGRNAI
jgi:hypothetical protein